MGIEPEIFRYYLQRLKSLGHSPQLKVNDSFSLQKRLLPLDNVEAHMTESVKKLLKELIIEYAFTPVGCTKYIQTLGVL